MPFRINEGDGAFYGLRSIIHIPRCFRKILAVRTVQLDMALPEKFELEYMDKDGTLKRPCHLHRAILDRFERFFRDFD
jgi:threonyl-tRNA synthetase